MIRDFKVSMVVKRLNEVPPDTIHDQIQKTLKNSRPNPLKSIKNENHIETIKSYDIIDYFLTIYKL